jgi:hypothetical protein
MCGEIFMAQESPSRHLAQFQLRLPDGMREKLKETAQKANRTLNAEIVSRLQFTLDADVVVQEDGFDVGLSIGTPEWSAAIAKRNSSDGRQMSDADLDYIVDRLADRLASRDNLKELPQGVSKALLGK